MRVKIGDTWYSSDELPICVELTDSDKKNIAEMPEDSKKYASAPDDAFDSISEFRKWMK